MNKEKTLLIRYGAFGDHLYALPLIDHLLRAGVELHLHTNPKGWVLFKDDPRFASLTVFDPFTIPVGRKRNRAIDKAWRKAIADTKAKEVINLSHTLENTGVATRDVPELFDAPIEERRKILGERFFYGIPLHLGGFNPYLLEPGKVGTLAYTDYQIEWGQGWRKSHREQFVVLMVLQGTTLQKRFPIAREVGEMILSRYPDAVLYLAGDHTAEPFSFGDGRVYNTILPVGNFKQVLLMARYADYVIGPETGMLVGAGMWGTPKTMLCTSSSIFQCTHMQKNDFSLQAAAWCSPCMRAVYKPKDCHLPVLQDRSDKKRHATYCNFKFDPGKVLDGVDLVYRTMRYMPDLDEQIRTVPLRVPRVRTGDVQRPRAERHLQPGIPAEI